jgi:hypothetical protein
LCGFQIASALHDQKRVANLQMPMRGDHGTIRAHTIENGVGLGGIMFLKDRCNDHRRIKRQAAHESVPLIAPSFIAQGADFLVSQAYSLCPQFGPHRAQLIDRLLSCRRVVLSLGYQARHRLAVARYHDLLPVFDTVEQLRQFGLRIVSADNASVGQRWVE